MQCFAGAIDQGMLFVRCFFVIMQREWPGVDRFRKNKFYSLVCNAKYPCDVRRSPPFSTNGTTTRYWRTNSAAIPVNE